MVKPKQSPAKPKKVVKDLAPKAQGIKGGHDDRADQPDGMQHEMSVANN